MLIVSAASFETAPLYEKYCDDPTVSFFYFGVGCLEAARRESMLLALAAGKEVWVVGTCGSWESFSGVKLISANRFLWMPICERAGLSESIEGLEVPFCAPQTDIASLLPSYTILCGPTIANSNKIQSHIKKKYQLEEENLAENIEFYVVAKNLLRVAKKVNFLLAITNQVGTEGRKQWRENFREAAIISSQFIHTQIQACTDRDQL